MKKLRGAQAPQLSMGRRAFRVTYPQTHGGADDYIDIVVEDDGSLTLRGHDGRLVIRADVSNKINVSLERFQ